MHIRACLVSAFVLIIGPVVSYCSAAGIPQIQHVIIITQENRSVDTLFAGLDKVLPGADVKSTGVTSSGQVVPLVPISLSSPFDMSHAYVQFRSQYNNGQMNGNDRVHCTPATGYTSCPPLPGFSYVNHVETKPYFDMAVNYGFANRMFQSNRGPSVPAHLEIFAGGSEPVQDSNLFEANNLNDKNFTRTGCASQPSQTSELIGSDGNVAQNVFPCFEHPVLTDILDAPPSNPQTPISWRYYTNLPYGLFNVTALIRHICQPATVGGKIDCIGPHFTDGHIVFGSPNVLVDIMQNKLAAVTWVNPPPTSSDHPLGGNTTGPSWVSAIVNTVGQSAFWNNTVILVTWDDWGGFYDHVAPPSDILHGYFQHGFRVPLLVISPYTKAGYISYITHDFGSLIKFIETVFDLPLVPPGTFSDSKADDLSDFFDFAAAPRAFVPISAPFPPSYFIDMLKMQIQHPETVRDDPDPD